MSYFDIGDLFYSSGNQDQLKKLQTLQNKALHCVYVHDKTLSTFDLHKKAGLMYLQDRRNLNLTAFAHKANIDCYRLLPPRVKNVRSNNDRLIEKPLARNGKFENCFVYSSIELWNNTKKDLKELRSQEYKLFKHRLKCEMWYNFINFPILLIVHDPNV